MAVLVGKLAPDFTAVAVMGNNDINMPAGAGMEWMSTIMHWGKLAKKRLKFLQHAGDGGLRWDGYPKGFMHGNFGSR